MIESRHIGKLTAIVLALAVLFVAVLAVLRPEQGYSQGQSMAYAQSVFGQTVMKVEITADPDTWQQMLDTATSEEYITADVAVNGKTYSSVGLRTKGNSSLSSVAGSDSDRYSFKIKFDKYVSNQTLDGLDMLVLNNMYGDSSYMKEYMTYDIMHYLEVESSLMNFAAIYVNGEYWGLYFALEAYRDSFLQRSYGDESGNLYSVKSMEMGNREENMPNISEDRQRWQRDEAAQEGQDGAAQAAPNGNMPQRPPGMGGDGNTAGAWPMEEGGQMPQPPDFAAGEAPKGWEQMPAQGENNQENQGGGGMMGGFGGMMGGRGNGADLQYIDDDPASYSSIFNNTITNNSDEADYARLIEAIKALNEGENLEEYFDVDEILRYLAAHTFVVNMDSYSSSMCQNYYIYENDGIVSILPWDYNYAFGGFQSGSVSSAVNFPIDTPVSGVAMESRPLISKLLENEEYLALYHAYLQKIVDGYVGSGLMEVTMQKVYAEIVQYVKDDPSSFSGYEQFEKSFAALKSWIELRAQSVKGQLDGSIPSTTEGQSADSSALVDASSISSSDLGGMGGGMGGGGNRQWGGQMRPGEENAEMPGAELSEQEGEFALDGELMQKAMSILMENQGQELSEEVKEELRALGLSDEMIENLSSFQMPGNMNFGGNMGPMGAGMSDASSAESSQQNAYPALIFAGILVVLLAAATLIVARAKRNF